MHFETEHVGDAIAGYGTSSHQIAEGISKAHQRAAELGGRIIASVAHGNGIYLTSALPDNMEEERALALIPSIPAED